MHLRAPTSGRWSWIGDGSKIRVHEGEGVALTHGIAAFAEAIWTVSASDNRRRNGELTNGFTRRTLCSTRQPKAREDGREERAVDDCRYGGGVVAARLGERGDLLAVPEPGCSAGCR